MCCDSPDTSGINRAAVDTAALSKEALAWYKDIYARQEPDRAAAAAKATEVADAQIDAMKTATGQAKELDAYNKGTFRPLEQSIVTDSTAYDTPNRRMQAAASAASDVDDSFADVQAAQQRAIQRTGGSVTGERGAALMQQAAIEQAKARAGASTTAVRNVEQQGYARRMDAAALGRNLPSQQATQQQIATTAGNSGAGNAQTALQAVQSGNSTMQQGFSTAIQGNQAAGNLYGQAANIQQQASGDLMSGLVGLGSLGAKLWSASDRGVKKGTGRMANGAKMLADIEKTPVHDGWQYDPAKGGPDDGGQKHTGPMAQDVRRVSGEQAAPGGKVINLADRMGRMEAAMQELAKQVKQKEAA